jgi:hypothetical protein
MKRLLLFIVISALCCGPMSAQRHKSKKKAKEVVEEKTPEEKLYDELLFSTAKIMFIDSMVVDKADFLSKLPIPESLGKIAENNGKISYTNEFGNTEIFAAGDTISGRNLYITHRYGDKWDEPQIISELNNEMQDYPFLMTDGVTLYFSAEGEGTVGGRDIFRTTYNADDSHFYDATNMGLPYNSPANEYMLAIDDFNNIGWLVSDRFQPEGKVCIYIFEPTDQRQTFNEDVDKETIKKYAEIESIKNTWQFGNRDEAMGRYRTMTQRQDKKDADNGMEFVINDQEIYTSVSDFKNKDARKMYQELINNKKNLAEMQKLLNNARDNYAQATKSKKYEIGRKIISLENEINLLEEQTYEKEKEIRRLEKN